MNAVSDGGNNMSDTPRTDKECERTDRDYYLDGYVWAEFARELEREIRALREIAYSGAGSDSEIPYRDLARMYLRERDAAVAAAKNAAPQALTDKEGQSVPSPATAAHGERCQHGVWIADHCWACNPDKQTSQPGCTSKGTDLLCDDPNCPLWKEVA